MLFRSNVYIMMNGHLTKFLDVATLLENNPNVRMVHTSQTHKLWEWPGLDFLKRYCDQLPEGKEEYVMYFHTKGLSKLNQGNIRDWRHYMEYWNIDRWRDCVALLDDNHDCVGTNWISKPFIGIDGRTVRNWKHYSGNFWWARASYIRKLESLTHPDSLNWNNPSKLLVKRNGQGVILDKGNFRFEHEAWIGSAQPVWVELHAGPGKRDTGWHYKNNYAREEYATETSTTAD